MAKDPSRWFQDEDHALLTGFLTGTLAKAGVAFNIARDSQGNYKPFIEIVIREEGELEPIRVLVQVMPGPESDANDS
jgi:hypothetical protein